MFKSKDLLDVKCSILNSIDNIPDYKHGYYGYEYKGFYVRAFANYGSQKVVYNICDLNDFNRLIYQGKFEHLIQAFNFIDKHYEYLTN